MGRRSETVLIDRTVAASQALLTSLAFFASLTLLVVGAGAFTGFNGATPGAPAADPAAAIGGGDIGAGQTEGKGGG